MATNPRSTEPPGAARLTELLTEEEASRFLRISMKTLSTWRSLGRYRLPYLKIGGRVRYEQTALRDWLQSRMRTATKPPARAADGQKRTNLKKTA